ncbi:MAG: hypothetical protein JSR33_03540, partial [Proteobacteria bacterium]|nr:hypothetical protein [Pseudomonadota bacterium]
CLLLDIGLGAADTFNTYKQHGNWIKKGLEETGGIAANYIAGSAAVEAATIILGFVPGIGWTILIGCASAVALSYGAKWLVGEAYDWEVKHHVFSSL